MTTQRNDLLIGLVSVVVIATWIPKRAEAQDLARRVAAAPAGKVRLTFAARPNICGHGTVISYGNNTRTTWGSATNEDVEYTEDCSQSPVRLVLEVSGGAVTKIRTYVGGRWRPATRAVTDLGNVSTRDATSFLLGLASSGSGRVAQEAIFPATLADSVVVWPALLRLARDDSRPSEVRKQAVFWLGQAAGDAVTSDLARLAGENNVDREVRKAAVFALSQRRNSEGVSALIHIARTNRDPEVRKSALFWLGQSRDPRALALFEEILTR